MDPLLSIICPMYRVRIYLQELVDSLVASANSEEVEIIFVDDCCPEHSGDLCKEILDGNSTSINFKWKLVRLEVNGGSGNARNHGCKIASGRYIGFVDPDDIVLDQYWEKIKKSIYINNFPPIIEFGYVEFTGEKALTGGPNGGINLSSLPQLQPFITGFFAWSRVYRSDLLVGVEFDSGIYEDIAFVAKAFIKANTLTVLPFSLIGYRKRPGSVTAHRDSTYSCILANLLRSYEKQIDSVADKKVFHRFLFKKIVIILLKGYRINNREQRRIFFTNCKTNLSSYKSLPSLPALSGYFRRAIFSFVLFVGEKC